MEEARATQPKAKFELGYLVITPGAKAKLTTEEIVIALTRHAQGDWGILTPHDWQENEAALVREGRIFSVYDAADGDNHFYVITECDRSQTTLLMPDEY